MKRHSAAVAVLVLTGVVGALVTPSRAGAHAVLLRADPADGGRLSSSPHRIRLWFSEDVSSRFRSARLVATNGREIAHTRLRESGSGRLLVLDTPKLPKSTYGLVWRVLAEDDGHATSGTIAFGVGTTPSAASPAPNEPLPSATDAALRWLRFSLIALVLGCLAFTLAVLERAPARPEGLGNARQGVLATAALGSMLGVAVGFADLAHQVSTVGDGLGRSSLGLLRELLLTTRWGHLWAIELAAFVGLVLVSRRLLRRTSRSATGCAGALAASLVVSEALRSHAAALHRPLVAVAADALHVAAAATWLGGVAALALALLSAARVDEGQWRGLALACRRPFAKLAGASVGVLVVTGLYSAGREVSSVDAMLTTFYGRTLLAKSALVAIVCALGATNALLLRRLATGRAVNVRRTVAAEAVLGGLVLLAAGVLTASTPARGPQFTAPRAVHPATAVRQSADLLLAVSVRPNRPGTNLFTVQAASSRRPPPAPVSSVSLRLESGAKLQLRPIQANRYVGFAPLSGPGVDGMRSS
jgi:copper transport protein